MAKIYLSSTYKDLAEARTAVYRVLRKMGHDVVAMEDYVSSDQRPLDQRLDQALSVGTAQTDANLLATGFTRQP